MGAIPSGSDPSGYDLTGWDAFPGAGFSVLATRTESNVRAQKKLEVGGNDVLSQIFGLLYQGLQLGISFPIAILNAFVGVIFPGLSTNTSGTLEDFLADLKEVPLLGDLVEIITGQEDGDLNDLGTWALGVASDIQGVAQNIINAALRLDPVGVLGALGQGIWDVITGLDTRGNATAQGLLALEAEVRGESGTLIDFSQSDANTIPGWTMLKFGLGTQGSIGIRANGAYWHAGVTANNQTDAAILDDTSKRLGSHLQKTSHQLRQKVALTGPCAHWLALRANHTTDRTQFDCQYVRLEGDQLFFGYMLNGVSHDLTSSDHASLGPRSYTQSDQDRWTFQAGSPTNDWVWRLWQNGTELTPAGGVVFDLTSLDAGCSVLLDADHDYLSFGMTADGQFIFVPFQVGPTEVEFMQFLVPAA